MPRPTFFLRPLSLPPPLSSELHRVAGADRGEDGDECDLVSDFKGDAVGIVRDFLN